MDAAFTTARYFHVKRRTLNGGSCRWGKNISAGWLLASVTCDCAKILKYQFGSGSRSVHDASTSPHCSNYPGKCVMVVVGCKVRSNQYVYHTAHLLYN